MVSKAEEKKIERKQKRCQHLVSNDAGVQCCDQPTANLAVCNAGLSSGLQQETLLAECCAHGDVRDIIMVQGKSYCFIQCADVTHAQTIYNALHGQAHLAQNGGIVYLSYCDTVPKSDSTWSCALPPGLIILPDFVTPDEESLLVSRIDCDDSEADVQFKASLKHRQVKHFGYEFLYDTNGVDVNRPLERGIPAECDMLWERIAERSDYQMPWTKPDQLTVNKYEAGQGIPPHADTHSAFHDPIVSLSLLSDVVMEFRQPADINGANGKQVSVLLPRRSLLIMSQESRYGWTHGITPRKIDVYQNDDARLSTFHRDTRISFTFRSLKHDPCECTFKTLCDTHREREASKTTAPSSEFEALQCPSQLELENVHKVYDEIANHFSETRHSPWPQVEQFVTSFPAGSVLADIGCGNGKYLSSNKNILNIGCDRSSGLLNVCRQRQLNVFQCDCLAVPIRSRSVDACISIAVIHHLASRERRLAAIKEMARILVVSGRALIYVWAKNQAVNTKSSYLRQNKKNNRPTTEATVAADDASDRVEQNLNDDAAVGNGLPIHTNRTQFVHQDILVPWKLKKGGGSSETNTTKAVAPDETFLRFYHVFEEHELECLCGEVDDIQVIKSYYDQGNWCVIFERVA